MASPSEYASPVARLSSQQQAAGDDTYDSLQRHGPDRNGGSAVMTGSERQRSAICHSLATSFGGEDDIYVSTLEPHVHTPLFNPVSGDMWILSEKKEKKYNCDHMYSCPRQWS